MVAQPEQHRGDDGADLRLVAQVEAKLVLHPVMDAPREGHRLERTAGMDQPTVGQPAQDQLRAHPVPAQVVRAVEFAGVARPRDVGGARGQFQAVARPEQKGAVAPIDGTMAWLSQPRRPSSSTASSFSRKRRLTPPVAAGGGAARGSPAVGGGTGDIEYNPCHVDEVQRRRRRRNEHVTRTGPASSCASTAVGSGSARKKCSAE